MAKSKTFVAIPPGYTIKEQLDDRGIKQKEFALRMEMLEKHISKLINGEVLLTTDMALRLEMVLDISQNENLKVSLLHELGHIVLGHIYQEYNSKMEEDAETFVNKYIY